VFAGKYFERSGFCFAPVVETEGGAAVLCIYFQNRHEREVVATIAMQPGLRSFRASRLPLPSASVQIHCPGVAFGVARLPFAVPEKYHGKRLAFELAADVSYPRGRGKMIRMHSGLRAGPTANLNQGTRLLNSLAGLLLLGLLREESPARASVVVPPGVNNSLPDHHAPRVQILWQPTTEAASAPARRAAA